ncbi:phosphatase PAP2 family protein [Chitinispirillales bacterium ANBcel5]|uniref:phosphatase PAP2 family protein n=1 Tax=Cellulosispirillum alkaliphilum TaxID=3039283 RepID=UPI002A596D03|nr:phosphatase PAP2 family protein [Chitinispirillales bacterium ANBcel5]
MFLTNSLENPSTVPSGKRVKEAFITTVKDPSLWIGTAAAVTLAATRTDKSISKWASENTLVFGSRERAEQVSGYLRTVSIGTTTFLYSLKYMPPGGNYRAQSPLAAFQATLLSSGFTIGTTEFLKRSLKLQRPDYSDFRSFPSGHVAISSLCNTLSINTVESLSFPRSYRVLSSSGLTLLSAATAWARLESGRHHPTDLITGALLGKFFANFFYRSFMGPYQPLDPRFDIRISPEMLQMRLSLQF